MKKLSRIFSLVLAIALCFSVCSFAVAEEPQYGGTAVFTIAGTHNQVGYPAGSGTQNKWSSIPAIESLGRYAEDGTVTGWLAKDIVADADALSITITLNEGIMYHDGTPFNAQAVVDVWNIYKENGTGANFFDQLESFEAADEYTVAIKLKNWTTTIVPSLCLEVGYMISPAEYAKVGLEGIYTDIVGTGPFKCANYDVTMGVEYVRNDEYWGGKPYLDGINIIFCSDGNSQENIFLSGEATMMYQVSHEAASRLSKDYELIYTPSCISPTLTGIFFASGNTEDPISNVLVRRAFCHAIDKQAIVDTFTYGLGQPMQQIAVPGTIEYNPDVAGYEYDVEKAKALLKEAGYGEGECNITFYIQNGQEDLYTVVAAMLEKAGFKVTPDTRTGSENRIIYGTSDPYTCCTGFYAPTTFSNWYRYFSATPFTYAVNTIDTKACGIVDTYEACRGARTAEEQHEALMKLQELVTEQCMYCPIYAAPELMMISDGKLQDHHIAEIWTLQWTPEKAWMKN